MRQAITALVSLATLALMNNAETAAHVQRWAAHPDKSTLGFVATQEGAEFTGRFQKFSSGLEIFVDEDKATLQTLSAVIQLASVDTNYEERDEYLVQKDWFYTELWPEARFVSESLVDQGEGSYLADGKLTMRGVSQDVRLDIQLDIEDNLERGTLKGTGRINRLDFGVGQGDWASTEWVGDPVKVEFDLHIIRAFE